MQTSQKGKCKFSTEFIGMKVKCKTNQEELINPFCLRFNSTIKIDRPRKNYVGSTFLWLMVNVTFKYYRTTLRINTKHAMLQPVIHAFPSGGICYVPN